MSEPQKRMSHWKLMMVGTFSVTFRRLFVITLTGLSLIVWTVTVIGTGVLRSQSGLGGAPTSASASIVPPRIAAPHADSDLAAVPPVVTQEAPDEPQVPMLPAVADIQDVQLPDLFDTPARDPFVANETFFPRPKVEVDGDEGGAAQQQAADNTPDLDAGDIVPLALEGTLRLGSHRVAIVKGNSVSLDGQTLLLMLKEVKSRYVEGDESVNVKDIRSQFKIGEDVEVRPLVKGAGGYLIGENAETLTVRSITRKKIVFGFNGNDCKLEMGK